MFPTASLRRHAVPVHACPPACLLAYLLSFLPARSHMEGGKGLACLLARTLTRLPACLLACLRARLRACLLA